MRILPLQGSLGLRGTLRLAGLAVTLALVSCGEPRTISLLSGPIAQGTHDSGGRSDAGVKFAKVDAALPASGCMTNADCAPAAPICDLDVHLCVQCEIDAQCPSGEVCAFESHRCAPACQTSANCAGSGRPFCAAASRVCVECTSDGDCASVGKQPHCDLRTGTCVACLSDLDCTVGRCQTFEHLCVECLTSGDCDGRACDRYRCGP